jgi:hypothetical protein
MSEFRLLVLGHRIRRARDDSHPGDEPIATSQPLRQDQGVLRVHPHGPRQG